jgi:hypothetical protein
MKERAEVEVGARRAEAVWLSARGVGGRWAVIVLLLWVVAMVVEVVEVCGRAEERM